MALAYPDPPLADGLVRLRPWREGDAGALAAAWADPTIQETCAVPNDRTEAAAAGWISRHDQRVARRMALDLVVSDEGGVDVWGEVGLGPFDPSRRAAVLGFWIGSAHRGVGRARSAVMLVVDWAFSADIEVLFAQTTATNLGSIGVLRSCGFEQLVPSDAGADEQTWVRRSVNENSRL